ncbi:MAG: ABC transporter ATPase [Moheibacter sp.]
MNLPSGSKVWIFQSIRNFTETEQIEIEQILNKFMEEWNAHGAALSSDFSIYHNRFIVIATDENQVQASGCSIDSMTRVIKSIEEKYKFGLLNRMLISYRSGSDIMTLPLPEFKQKVKSGELNEETIIFNNSLTHLNEFNAQWEIPVKESWAKSLVN